MIFSVFTVVIIKIYNPQKPPLIHETIHNENIKNIESINEINLSIKEISLQIESLIRVIESTNQSIKEGLDVQSKKLDGFTSVFQQQLESSKKQIDLVQKLGDINNENKSTTEKAQQTVR